MLEWLISKGIEKLFSTIVGKIVFFPFWVCHKLGQQARRGIEELRQIIEACNRTGKTFQQALTIPALKNEHTKYSLKIIGALLFISAVDTLLLLLLPSEPAWILSACVTGMMLLGFLNVTLEYKIDASYSAAIKLIPIPYWLSPFLVVLTILGIHIYTSPEKAPAVIPTVKSASQASQIVSPKIRVEKITERNWYVYIPPKTDWADTGIRIEYREGSHYHPAFKNDSSAQYLVRLGEKKVFKSNSEGYISVENNLVDNESVYVKNPSNEAIKITVWLHRVVQLDFK